MQKKISKKYEDKIYQKWEESGYFNPDNLTVAKDAKNYSIVMPPPNVTGVLHVGHAAMLAYEDILIRYHRMKGDRTLWLPGTDHAAIATQTKVEKIIKEKNQTRHSLGRREFLKKVNKFAQDSHDTIKEQVKKMGSSCDWSREAYTLDETRHKAVYSVFKMMYDDGLIYQGERIVNWCPRCHSTLADDEVEHENKNAKLYTFKYDKNFPIEISTTRPETKLGDVAVAVNPKDKRYKKFIGKKYNVVFCTIPLEIKIVADKEIDMNFGSGAVGVTPAHSLVDWQIAEKNNLPSIKVINEKGTINNNLKEFSGLKTIEAKKRIVEKLKKSKLLSKEEDIQNNLSICYRCGEAIEPLPSKQWFVDVNKKIPKHKKSIKELSIEAVERGVFGKEKIKIYPKRFEKIYFNWMKDLRDWCISRQIWFGHQIPVWYKEKSINLTLVRHTQTDWNKQGIMQGQTDIPLNEKGKKQAAKLRELIKEEKIDTIIISPLARTRQTAEIINNKNLKIIEDNRLKERFYGKFEGQKTEDLLKNHTEITTFEVDGCPYWIDVPTAESYEKLRLRVEDFLEDIKNKYAGKNVLVVSHGDTLDMFYAAINNIPNERAYGKFSLNGTFQKYQIEAEEVHVGTKKPKEKNNFVFLHAFKSNSKENFWPWIKKNLKNDKIFLKDLPNSSEPKLKEQMEFVLNKADLSKNTTIVGHSLGCALAMKLIAKNNLKIKKLILIAPPLQAKDFADGKKRPILEKYCNWKFNFKKIKRLVGEVVIFIDKKDPVVRTKDPKKIAEELSAKVISIEMDNHFCCSEFNELLKEIKKDNWRQDPDTLDTWFSSGLWTFSTLAHSPEQIKIENGQLKILSEDFKNFHPNSIMETGYDILFFWIARMIIMTTYAVKDIPFNNIYLHGLVLDGKGKKMSKSKGNTLNPLELCKEYGTDATRLSLIIGTSPGSDTKISTKKIEGERNFVNKLWNIVRYILENYKLENKSYDPSKLTLIDSWILGKMEKLIEQVETDLENYKFSQACEKIREFTWNSLADWYIEASKFEKDKTNKEKILNTILKDLLKLWHPFIPFVTEKIWETIGEKDLLMIETWPRKEKYKDVLSNQKLSFQIVKKIIKTVRNARTEYNIKPGKKIDLVISSESEKYRQLIQSQENLIKNLRTGIENIETTNKSAKIPNSIYIAIGQIEIYIPLNGVIDIKKEKNRLRKEMFQSQNFIIGLEKKLANKKFIKNAPKNIINKEQEKLTFNKKNFNKMKNQIDNLK